MLHKNKNGAISSLVILAATYGLSWLLAITIAPTYQAVTLRELTETEQARIYLFNKVGGDLATYKKWDSIIRAESSWNLNAVNKNKNGTQDSGALQINDIWEKTAKEYGYENYKEEWRDNIDLAFVIAEKQPTAWYASYKKHKIRAL